MPTSATGIERRPAEAGFTLVELLVVLAVLGLMTSVAVLAAPRGGPSLAAEAEQFGARLTRAKEEAVLTNRPIGVEVTPAGYAFRARTGTDWTPLEDGPFRTMAWGEGTVAAVDGHDPTGRVSFEATGAAEPLAVTLSRDARHMRVSVDASGNIRVDAGA